MDAKGLTVTILLGLLTLALFLAVDLVAAGQLDYWQAWAQAAALGTFMAAGFLFVPEVDQLAKERAAPGPGAKPWDIVFLGFFFVFYFAVMVVAGLDVGRFHWTGRLCVSVYVLAYVGYVSSCAAMMWAMRVNRFFSSVVRIQTERGHRVIDTGPYAWVRHPGYVGALLYVPCTALTLGSLWALLPAVAILAALIVRTYLEDETLKSELPGYKDYATRVRWRLVPGLW